MEIIILLTILFIITLLGGLFFQGGKVCLIVWEQMVASLIIKYNLKNALSIWAVKLVGNIFYLLNIVALVDALNSSDTTLIQPQNSIFVG